MHGTYIGNGKMLVKPVWGGKLMVNSDDLSIGPDLILNGFYDGPFTNYLLKTVRQGNLCIDVGANIGTFTVLMGILVGESGHVYAYEASPLVLPTLHENIEVNYLSKWVDVIERAAYSKHAGLTFYATRRFQGNGSLLEHDQAYRTAYSTDEYTAYDVQAEPLDEVIGDRRVDLVKVDVEGAEPEVFAGMQHSLAGGRIKAVVFEMLRQRMGAGYQDFANTLRDYDAAGWRFYRIDEQGASVPLGVEYLIAVGNFTQVVMTQAAA